MNIHVKTSLTLIALVLIITLICQFEIVGQIVGVLLFIALPYALIYSIYLNDDDDHNYY